MVSLFARRCLMRSSENTIELFFQQFYSLFKGDIRVTSTKDEFILAQIDMIDKVVGKAIKMSLKLYQDHFVGEDYEDYDHLFSNLSDYERELVCCHEEDPLWRRSILDNAHNLLSLRKQMDPNALAPIHYVVSLTLRYMSFRVIQLNRESVRGLWAGQVQELVFLGSTNPERGSIQQLKTVVRNLVNQSCDFPVGYPIFVSSLTTSYSSIWPRVFHHGKIPKILNYFWSGISRVE